MDDSDGSDESDDGVDNDDDKDNEYTNGSDEEGEIGDHSVQDIRDLVKDAINNKDRGEMDADNPVRNLPFGPEKLRELYVRSGASRIKEQLLHTILSIAICILLFLL